MDALWRCSAVGVTAGMEALCSAEDTVLELLLCQPVLCHWEVILPACEVCSSLDEMWFLPTCRMAGVTTESCRWSLLLGRGLLWELESSSLACPRAMCHGQPSGWPTLGTPGKLGRFSAASQGVEWLQMLPPDWSWEFEGQLNLLMLVLWCRVWEMVMRHEAEQLARLLLEWLCSADSS